MQYLVSVIDDDTGFATPDELAAVEAYHDELRAGGHWVFAGGLAALDTATVIDNRGRGTRAGCRGVEGLQPEGRGAAVQ
jgi:hypothetical protein